MSGQVVFILWRESVEALLVIGILAGWLRHEGGGRRAALALWGGVAAGLGLALAFALTMLGVAEVFGPAAGDWLSTAMVFVAAGLIVQMVVWMRAHGRSLKRDIETGLRRAGARGQWWSVFLLAALAVAREGSETVVFLYGTLAATGPGGLAGPLMSVAAGMALAAATYFALQAGAKFLPWRRFFQMSEAMLLLLGASLAVSGAGALVGQGVLPYTRVLWDSSALLDDSSRFGGLVAALTGYRAAPDQVTLIAWLVYWGLVAVLLVRQSRRRRVQAA